MKQKTRDNLIYLAVGLGIVGIILADLFFADKQGRRMWWPSTFAIRASYTTVLLAYFVAREARKARATLAQVLACILFAGIVNLAIVFTFRRVVDNLSGLSFSAVAIIGIFPVFQLAMAVARYLGCA